MQGNITGPDLIKIHGLQRSGTNYLSHLMNENFQNVKVLVNAGGWKHGHYMAPLALNQEVHVVAIVKNPYAWLVSVYKYWGPDKKLRIGPDLTGVSFEEFVRNRCYLELQRDIPYLFRSKNPVQFWNDMNFHWSSIMLMQKKICFITYESLLNGPKLTIDHIGSRLGIKTKNNFSDSDQTFTPSGENLHLSGEKFSNKDYYLKSEWIQQYTPELLEFVNEELDMDLMVNFGYNFMSAKDLKV